MPSNVCMRKLLFVLAAFSFTFGLSATETNSLALLKISAFNATNYYDQEMIVTGKVVQVTIRPTMTYLNLDEKYPDSPFAVVIFHSHSSFYGNANALKGKSIEIKGKIKNYHDRPEMSLDNTNQLTVIGVTNLELFLKPKIEPAPAISPSTNAVPSAPSTNSFPEIM